MDNSNILLFRPRHSIPDDPSVTADAALILAEFTRKTCLEHAASWVDMVRDDVLRNPELVSAVRMAAILKTVAGSIRNLKAFDGPTAPRPAPTTGGAA